MNRFFLLLFGICLFFTGCSNKSEFEQSAGDLTKEIKYVYNYFAARNSARPEFVAKSVTNINLGIMKIVGLRDMRFIQRVKNLW